MASSVVDLCNIALNALGQESILELSDDSKPARACNERYETARDAVLREHLWNCATKRAVLTKLSNAPVWGFANAFQIPADFIRFTSLDDLTFKYRIEGGDDGRVLVTDEGTVNLRYVFRLENVPQMDEGLKACIAARLAYELAFKLTSNMVLARSLFAVYKDKLAGAQLQDSQESPVEPFENRSWVDARFAATDDHLKPIDITT